MTISIEAVEAVECRTPDPGEVEGSGGTPPTGGVRRLAERGLTTVEYAIGLVAAATAALVLLRIFNDNQFFEALFDWVLSVFDMLAG